MFPILMTTTSVNPPVLDKLYSYPIKNQFWTIPNRMMAGDVWQYVLIDNIHRCPILSLFVPLLIIIVYPNHRTDRLKVSRAVLCAQGRRCSLALRLAQSRRRRDQNGGCRDTPTDRHETTMETEVLSLERILKIKTRKELRKMMIQSQCYFVGEITYRNPIWQRNKPKFPTAKMTIKWCSIGDSPVVRDTKQLSHGGRQVPTWYIYVHIPQGLLVEFPGNKE